MSDQKSLDCSGKLPDSYAGCKFQKDEGTTMSVLGCQPKKHANPSYKATLIGHNVPISDYY